MYWYHHVFFCGVRRLGFSLTKLSRDEDKRDVAQPWEHYFNFYWCFCIQYMTPALLWFVLIGALVDNINDPFGEYIIRWQIPALLVPIVGILLFLLPICICVYEHRVDEDLYEDEATRPEDKFADDSDQPIERLESVEEELEPENNPADRVRGETLTGGTPGAI